MNLLPTEFYHRDTVIVARELIGKKLVRVYNGQLLTGTIIETEAYRAYDDPASHAYNGKTLRNAAMFGPVGHAYVYFIYGIHYCLNIVARASSMPAGAVLIRGIMAQEGIVVMQQLRARQDEKYICNGPGKLTQALAIDRALDGISMLQEGSLYVLEGEQKIIPITESPRIGITRGKDQWWRFYV